MYVAKAAGGRNTNGLLFIIFSDSVQPKEKRVFVSVQCFPDHLFLQFQYSSRAVFKF